jgi:hypothetical protein
VEQAAEALGAEIAAEELHAIVDALRAPADSATEATKGALYIFHNRAGIRYPKFHSQDLCTSSGVLEAGCNVVIGSRLKRTGMHCTVRSANA